MTKVITVKVSKGGVGKTTICSNLASFLAKQDHKILLIDLDSQSNLTKSFIQEIDENKLTSSNLLGDDNYSLKNSVYSISDNLDIIGADIGLNEVSRFLENNSNYYSKLKTTIKNKEFKKYDFIFLDLSPGVADVLTEIAITASDLLICPTHFDIDSLTGLILTIGDASRLYEAKIIEENLNYLVVPNRYDRRFKSDNQKIINILYDNIDKDLIAEPIRENSHIKKARMIGKTAIEYEQDEKRKYEHKKAIEDFEKLSNKIIQILKWTKK